MILSITSLSPPNNCVESVPAEGTQASRTSSACDLANIHNPKNNIPAQPILRVTADGDVDSEEEPAGEKY